MRHLPTEQLEQEQAAQAAVRQAERAAHIKSKKKLTDALDLVAAVEKTLRGAIFLTPSAQAEAAVEAVALLEQARNILKESK